MPDGAAVDDVVFVMLFMYPISVTKLAETEMKDDNQKFKRYIVYTLIFWMLTMCMVIYLIVICITRKIVRTIRMLNLFSINMK